MTHQELLLLLKAKFVRMIAPGVYELTHAARIFYQRNPRIKEMNSFSLPEGWYYPYPNEPNIIAPKCGPHKDLPMRKNSAMAKALGWPASINNEHKKKRRSKLRKGESG